MKIFTYQLKLFRTYSAQDTSQLRLHVQNVAIFLPLSELMLNFPEAHHEGDQDCTVQDLIEHHCLTQHIPDYQCDFCNVRGLADKVTVITECPSILCVVLCRKKNERVEV
jgi:ubiquitin C-terminal hydrolase